MRHVCMLTILMLGSRAEGFALPMVARQRVGHGATHEVTLEIAGDARKLAVQEGDSILEAAEVAGLNPPSECRRGNCLSCAGLIVEGPADSLETYVKRRDGSRDPETFLCAEARQRGFILTCCSHVVGGGLHLRLGANTEAWKVQYAERYDDEETRRVLLAATASVMREYAERNPGPWREALEKQVDPQESQPE